MKQLSIFDDHQYFNNSLHNHLARKTDPNTSHEAAERLNFRQCHFDRILKALDTPAGKSLISERSGLSDVSIARRCSELIRDGKIRPTGKTCISNSGRPEREYEKVK